MGHIDMFNKETVEYLQSRFDHYGIKNLRIMRWWYGDCRGGVFGYIIEDGTAGRSVVMEVFDGSAGGDLKVTERDNGELVGCRRFPSDAIAGVGTYAKDFVLPCETDNGVQYDYLDPSGPERDRQREALDDILEWVSGRR